MIVSIQLPFFFCDFDDCVACVCESESDCEVCFFCLAVEILGFGSDCERLGADGGGDRHRCSAASWS